VVEVCEPLDILSPERDVLDSYHRASTLPIEATAQVDLPLDSIMEQVRSLWGLDSGERHAVMLKAR
jgi:hypothetical protein